MKKEWGKREREGGGVREKGDDVGTKGRRGGQCPDIRDGERKCGYGGSLYFFIFRYTAINVKQKQDQVDFRITGNLLFSAMPIEETGPLKARLFTANPEH